MRREKAKKVNLIIGIIVGVVLLVGLAASVVAISRSLNRCDEHTWNEGTVTRAATCQAEGEIVYECEECGEKMKKPLEKAAHEEIKCATILPTCEKDGRTSGMLCKNCGEYTVEPVVIPAPGHVVQCEKGQDVTCESDGVTDRCTCLRCGKLLQEHETIPAMGHDYDETGRCENCGKYGFYKITYIGVVDGSVTEIPSFLWTADGNYPTRYIVGETTQISDLRGKMEEFVWELEENELPVVVLAGSGIRDPEDSNVTYFFYGWYLDEACTQEFDGVITAAQKGHITLYAKISVDSEDNWTGNY